MTNFDENYDCCVCVSLYKYGSSTITIRIAIPYNYGCTTITIIGMILVGIIVYVCNHSNYD